MSLFKQSGSPSGRDEMGQVIEPGSDQTNKAFREQRPPKGIEDRLKESGGSGIDDKSYGTPTPGKKGSMQQETPGMTAQDSAPAPAKAPESKYMMLLLGSGIVGTALVWARKTGKI